MTVVKPRCYNKLSYGIILSKELLGVHPPRCESSNRRQKKKGQVRFWLTLIMGVTFRATSFSLPQSIEYGSGREGPTIVCFRCGECCTNYHVRLSLIEAQLIADGLGLAFDEWLDRYADKYWHQPESFVLRQRNGVCIFLEYAKGSNKTRCLIHHVKPMVCREWTPSLYRRECREGLAKYWRLTVSPSGQLEGAEEKLSDFYSFLE